MEGGKRHFGNYIADSLFLLFSEKVMKTTASKNHTDSAGKCSLELQEPEAAFDELWLFQNYSVFP